MLAPAEQFHDREQATVRPLHPKTFSAQRDKIRRAGWQPSFHPSRRASRPPNVLNCQRTPAIAALDSSLTTTTPNGSRFEHADERIPSPSCVPGRFIDPYSVPPPTVACRCFPSAGENQGPFSSLMYVRSVVLFFNRTSDIVPSLVPDSGRNALHTLYMCNTTRTFPASTYLRGLRRNSCQCPLPPRPSC